MTKENTNIFKGIQEFIAVSAEHAGPKYKKLFKEYDDLEGMDGFLAQIAAVNTPDPIGYADMINRAPYTNPQKIKDNFAGAVERGWLEEKEKGVFIASQKGQEFFVRIYDIAKKVYTELNHQAAIDLDRAVELFWIIMKTAENTKIVVDKPALTQSVKFSPKEGEPYAPLYILRNQVGDLQSYRDDAHVAAWKEHEIAGYVWETFSYLWEEKANTIAELMENLPLRGYEETIYAEALQELAQRGWVVEEDGKFVLTDEGKSLREEAEDLTNEYYFAAFAKLSEKDLEELDELLKQVVEDLQSALEPQI